MSKYNGGVKAKSSAKRRRQRALDRKEAQLKSRTKPYKWTQDSPREHVGAFVLMTDADVKRLEKEISTLKTRV